MIEDTQSNQIRDAASVVLLRNRHSTPKILVGQRGKDAVFMPNKFVFPGGAVDQEDQNVRILHRPSPSCLEKLSKQVDKKITNMLLACAVREVWEETGLKLAHISNHSCVEIPKNWITFCKGGHHPSAKGMVFFYRAVTPPGRTKRFDARFFLADLDKVDLVGNPDDFSLASTELRHLQWIPLADASKLDLPSITQLVLATLSDVLKSNDSPSKVPFRHCLGGQRTIEWI